MIQVGSISPCEWSKIMPMMIDVNYIGLPFKILE